MGMSDSSAEIRAIDPDLRLFDCENNNTIDGRSADLLDQLSPLTQVKRREVHKCGFVRS